jgi:hypothetical protein
LLGELAGKPRPSNISPHDGRNANAYRQTGNVANIGSPQVIFDGTRTEPSGLVVSCFNLFNEASGMKRKSPGGMHFGRTKPLDLFQRKSS